MPTGVKLKLLLIVLSVFLIASAAWALIRAGSLHVPVSKDRDQMANGVAAAFLPGSQLTAVWANEGGDKVTKDELRATQGKKVVGSIWNGTTVTQFGARNEVVSVNLILEAGLNKADNVSIAFDRLIGPDNAEIRSEKVGKQEVFNYSRRDIELFLINYLQIKGLSRLGYDPTYEDRHVPKRLRLPTKASKFADRPDANKFYPDIAVPMEAIEQFAIPKNENQGIWIDIYIPANAKPGIYRGNIEVRESGKKTIEVPITLEVLPFALPDIPSAKSILYFSESLVNGRYFGQRYPDLSRVSRDDLKFLGQVWNAHHLLAHRHKISLIDDGFTSPDKMARWKPVLNGDLFTPKNGYSGPGMGISSGVYSIGTYGLWRTMWSPDSEEVMRKQSDKWVIWFEKNHPNVDYFLYLLDEPQKNAFPKVEKWASWVKQNPGPGKRLKTLVTTDLVKQSQYLPSTDIAFTMWGDTAVWKPVIDDYQKKSKRYWAYNGTRISSGSFMIEDEGVSLRVSGWTQFKHKIDRWFFWESTAYLNTDRGGYETNVFEEAQTFGGTPWNQPKFGLTANGYGNGDGVLFYPGTEKRFTKNNFGLPGPIASLRLKLWRRGIQDADYLTLASKIDPQAVDRIVQRMIPKVLWEVGVSNPKDPTYVHTDVSWTIDAEEWEKARRELAAIILSQRK